MVARRNWGAGLVLTLSLPLAAPAVGSPTNELELLAALPPSDGIAPKFIEAILVRDALPQEVIVVTQNVGADCGGGTPASAWKLTLDPNTGVLMNVVLKQHLSEIQSVRRALLESSDGTVFAGGGWCGFKPPYVSCDGGESFRAATQGVCPPNSTFWFAEFRGTVYAGTGYHPMPGEIYRWLGAPASDWEYVTGFPWPRTIVSALAVSQDLLFAGTCAYPCSGWEGTTPVYVSADGVQFNATLGIPSYGNVVCFAVAGSDLSACVHDCQTNAGSLYRWQAADGLWQYQAPFDFGFMSLPAFVASGEDLYAYGQHAGDPAKGVYRSSDQGLTWQFVAAGPALDVMTLHVHAGQLYLGTYADSANTAYVYRLALVAPLLGDMNCDGVVNFADINPFVMALCWHSLYDVQFPHCNWTQADCNEDGYVDFVDINAFVRLLGAP